jgi:hypothetical protein
MQLNKHAMVTDLKSFWFEKNQKNWVSFGIQCTCVQMAANIFIHIDVPGLRTSY